MPEVARGPASVDVTCGRASEFLALLDPLRGLFTSGTFIFRGVSSKTHGLLPSAHRPNARLLASEFQIQVGPAADTNQQCAAECCTLDRFFAIVSRNGIRVPEDSYVLRAELEEWRVTFQQLDRASLKDKVWPSAGLYSLLALSQHFGIPTRALDWTSSAHIAAYFAARPALDTSRDDWIAVWAIDDFARQVDRILAPTADRPLRVFTVSGADNENLRAQRGLFMLHPERLDGTPSRFEAQEYNDLLLASLPVLKGAALFIRVLIHGSQAKEVLALLARAGITTGSLYPGLWGAAREYEDEQRVQTVSLGTPRTVDTIGLWDRIQKVAKESGA